MSLLIFVCLFGVVLPKEVQAVKASHIFLPIVFPANEMLMPCSLRNMIYRVVIFFLPPFACLAGL